MKEIDTKSRKSEPRSCGGSESLHKKLLLHLTHLKLFKMYREARRVKANGDQDSDVIHASSTQQVHAQRNENDVQDAAAALLALAALLSPAAAERCDVTTSRTAKRPAPPPAAAAADINVLEQHPSAKRAKLAPREPSFALYALRRLSQWSDTYRNIDGLHSYVGCRPNVNVTSSAQCVYTTNQSGKRPLFTLNSVSFS